ncbi:uncharacterized protein LOC129757055 [Uranotaenia lowii]|uniref:uncharacterized protein LOC129757055 n=1 Tax=Uranotaenia lowii TaxID=190385 RepID=UPI002478B19A|nr:uncharacterized protein LOC129757055 [Uranotaenia lowii]
MAAKVKNVLNKKPQKTVRNVLVQPFKTKWPQITKEETINVIGLLQRLPQQFVVHGSNDVFQLLHDGQACALLLSSDFHPQIFGKQIIRMARRNLPSIQILAIDDLKWQGKLEKLVAIRKSGNKNENVAQLLVSMDEIIKVHDFEDDLSQPSLPIKKKERIAKTRTNINIEDLSKLYLKRSSNAAREFIPPVSEYSVKLTKKEKSDFSGDFISFKRPRSDDDLLSTNVSAPHNQTNLKSSKKLQIKYMSLTVNRIVGNPERKHNKKK